MNKICCIYIIINTVTSKFYLGSTVDYNKRKTTHFRNLKQNIHHSKRLQNSYNKHGDVNFNINIYQYCTPEERLDLEQHYIDTLKPEYNMSKSSTAPMEGRKHTKDALLRMSEAHKGNTYNLGRKHSELTKRAMSESRIGTKRDDKTKNKMKETAKRINAIARIDRTKLRKQIIDSNGIIHNSLTEAARYLNSSIQAICDNLKGRSMALNSGIQLKYLNEIKDFTPEEVKLRRKVEKSYRSKLKNNDILRILELSESGIGPTKLAKIYNVRRNTIQHIKKGKTWGHIYAQFHNSKL